MKWFNSHLVLICGLVLLLGTANVASGAAPPNDDCDDAKSVGDVTNVPFDTTNATFDGPGHYITSPNIWYCYTATCTGCATISLAGSSFDTKLAVYGGCGCYPSAEDLIKKNDDSSGQQSEVTIPVKAGQQYLIEIGGFNPSVTGQGVLSISCDELTSGPTNDNCDNAKEVGNVTDLPFSTVCATFDGPGHYFTSPNIWYHYIATGTGDVTVSLLGSEFDTAMVIYDGYDCYPKESDIIDRNDDFGGTLQSQITFHATNNHHYLIEVMGYNSDEVGDGVLNITAEGVEPPPVSDNDECHRAMPISEVTNLPFDTTDATQDGPHHCMYSPNRWYCYTPSCTGEVTVSLAGSSFDTMLAVYEGCGDCEDAWDNMIECNDDTPDSRQSEIVYDAIAGNEYLIEVGGYGLEVGQGFLTVTCEGEVPEPPSKDDCENAKAIGDVMDQPFDTTDATFDGPGLCMTSPNIWYCYTATCTGNATVSLAGSSFDTMLAVYDGCDCYPTSGDLIECNDDSGAGYQSAVTFAAVQGNQYLIEVGGYGSDAGEGLISISCSGEITEGKTDLGDAPDSTNHLNRHMTAYAAGHTGLPQSIPGYFPTVYDDGSGTGPYGPVHLNDEMVAYLGTRVTWEFEADTGPDEDGRNNLKVEVAGSAANHDGGDDTFDLKIPFNLPNCCWTTIDYKVTVVDPDVDLWVNIWFDWNRDGDWDDVVDCPEGPAPEWAVQNQFLYNLPVGLNTITSPAFLPWHPEDIRHLWFRITISEQPWKTGSNPGELGNGGSGPQEKYLFGETEDYYIIPEQPLCCMCKDHNGDGNVDMDDLVYYTDQWLDQCP